MCVIYSSLHIRGGSQDLSLFQQHGSWRVTFPAPVVPPFTSSALTGGCQLRGAPSNNLLLLFPPASPRGGLDQRADLMES